MNLRALLAFGHDVLAAGLARLRGWIPEYAPRG